MSLKCQLTQNLEQQQQKKKKKMIICLHWANVSEVPINPEPRAVAAAAEEEEAKVIITLHDRL
jgi:hypothetical protein